MNGRELLMRPNEQKPRHKYAAVFKQEVLNMIILCMRTSLYIQGFPAVSPLFVHELSHTHLPGCCIAQHYTVITRSKILHRKGK